MDNGGLINGGYMLLRPEVFNYLENDNTVFEEDPLRNMCSDGVLKSFVHNGFWRAMDTLRDKMILDDLVQNKKAPWIY
jgi:glucose-1-phosphate cytidylyltransferase